MRPPSSLAFLFAPLLLTSTFTAPALAVSPSDLPADTPVKDILRLAQSALVSGSSSDALRYYDIAIDRDPSNYLSVFKRGATYLSLGRAAQALADFNKVLTLKPGFEGALLQRAKLRSREANWQGAREDYLAAGKKQDAEELTTLAEAEGAAHVARDSERHRKWEDCVTQSGAALMIAPAALHLRQMRARCRLEKGGEEIEALGDLQQVLNINPAETRPALLVSATFFYGLGETDKGVEAVTKCLHTDPDNKECSRLRKRQKTLNKALKRVRQLIDRRKFNDAIKELISSGIGDDVEPGLIEEVKQDMKEHRQAKLIHQKTSEGLLTQLLELTCNAYIEMNNFKKAQPYCTDLLGHNPEALPGLIHKAQAQIDADDFEGAIRTLNTAKEAPGGQGHHKINEMMQNAQTLLKRSKTKDYYKVLGVDRSASAKEIKKAYRKLVTQNHPDKVQSPEARPAAEKKTAAINEAYEVLSDPELRARFDQGDDPNSPEGQRGPNPFQGGGFPGGFPGGGFQGFPGGQQFVFQQGGGRSGGGGGFHFQFP